MTKEEKEALLQYRLERAYESIKAAEIMHDNGFYIPSMDRIYYSMFYATLALLASKQLFASRHSGVISLFHRGFVKSGIVSPEAAKFLDIAFNLRSKSDYKDFVTLEESSVKELLKESENCNRGMMLRNLL